MRRSRCLGETLPRTRRRGRILTRRLESGPDRSADALAKGDVTKTKPVNQPGMAAAGLLHRQKNTPQVGACGGPEWIGTWAVTFRGRMGTSSGTPWTSQGQFSGNEPGDCLGTSTYFYLGVISWLGMEPFSLPPAFLPVASQRGSATAAQRPTPASARSCRARRTNPGRWPRAAGESGRRAARRA